MSSVHSREELKTAFILGIGDISKGDLGLGCYVLETLSMETVEAPQNVPTWPEMRYRLMPTCTGWILASSSRPFPWVSPLGD